MSQRFDHNNKIKHSNTKSLAPVSQVKSFLTIREMFEKTKNEEIMKQVSHQFTKQITINKIVLKRQESNKII